VKRWVNTDHQCVSHHNVQLCDFHTYEWNEFIKNIQNDKIHREGCFGYFVRVSYFVYWFKFNQSYAFSTIQLSDIVDIFPVSAIIADFEQCKDHPDHSFLDKYFYDDGELQSPCALLINENEWSRRLVKCLQQSACDFLQGFEVDFHGENLDFNKLQREISGISLTDATLSYLYHGAPDILIKHHNAVVLNAQDEVHVDMDCPKSIENSKQPLCSYMVNNICLPQKLGEAISQAHFILSAYFLRCYLSGGTMPEILRGKALLLNKSSGGYQIEIVAYINTLSSSPTPVYVKLIRQRKLGTLTSTILCKHLKTLITQN